ncbi:MAG: ribonuclease E/G, partial [Methylocystis sp.]
MANKMLIDASHPEETRVVVLRGNRVQEFDFEAADKKPLRGNIYLAKVTRVEPSLQAAFVDYGGNRHGFLAFAEIHPDYYQIPVADRQALLEEESRAHQLADEEERAPHSRDSRGRRSRRRQYEGAEKRANADEAVTSEPVDDSVATSIVVEDQAETGFADAPDAETEAEAAVAASPAAIETEAPAVEPLAEEAEAQTESVASETQVAPSEEGEPPVLSAQHEQISIDPAGFGSVETGEAEEFVLQAPEPDHESKARRQDERDAARERAREESQDETADLHARVEAPVEEHDEEEHDDEEDQVEHIGGDAMDEAPYRAPRARRQYKIQEVIKRRQVLLVQVVKEERGNKGAALTTYLSLAGRYSVLMPNTARGGGISRKITDGADRKRLKEIVHD